MKMVKVNSPSEIKLQGIKTDAEFVDGKLNSLTLTDAHGAMVKFGQDYYSTFVVTVPAPPEMKRVHRVTAERDDVRIQPLDFEDPCAAQNKVDALRAIGFEASVELLEVAVAE